jgi:integrase
LVALPSVANWRLAAVPEVFTDVDIQQLLDSFIQLNCSPRRGHAMMRCPTDLGLKASEVIRPKLKDLDWHVGTIP